MRYATTRVALATLVSMLLGAGGAQAADAKLDVWVIQATASNAAIDPELRAIANQLKKQFKFTGYKLVKKLEATATPAGTSTALPHKYTLALKHLGVQGDQHKLEVKVLQQSGGKQVTRVGPVVLAAKRGQAALVGGLRLPSGDDRLVLALRVK